MHFFCYNFSTILSVSTPIPEKKYFLNSFTKSKKKKMKKEFQIVIAQVMK
ncbi:hypothetical protein FEM08_20420 [Flavobacterium gilvum]|nr:hypothetical protein FEM08_20420 [Flavobacterium gilvum]